MNMFLIMMCKAELLPPSQDGEQENCLHARPERLAVDAAPGDGPPGGADGPLLPEPGVGPGGRHAGPPRRRRREQGIGTPQHRCDFEIHGHLLVVQS